MNLELILKMKTITSVHSSTIHNSQHVETTQMSIHTQMDK